VAARHRAARLQPAEPERFGLEYIGADNQPHQPVMIHRAPLGSLERFMGVLIEHFAGAFPLWLAPEQVRVLTVSEKSRGVRPRGRASGCARPACAPPATIAAEKLGAKIRDAQLELIPYMFVVGDALLVSNVFALPNSPWEWWKQESLTTVSPWRDWWEQRFRESRHVDAVFG
jgi:threonyl-tRNA synthetase